MRELTLVVANALAACMGNNTQELAGAVISTPEGYRYTAPVQGQRDSFKLTLTIHKGEKLVALYHTHLGSDSGAEYFSNADISIAKTLGVPSYILVLNSGNVRVFTPGDAVTKGARLADGQIAAGKLVRLGNEED